ncbi:MAG: hypothetical protein IT429_14835 [Gemmataceae bacterium]|nr:hypothetical protein [Gemmataceae bacterium]
MKERIAIAVMDRGHVWVGRVSLDPDLAFHWRMRGRCIRQWGTSRGLAQLRYGPTSSTVLDDLADIVVPFRALLFFVEVEEAAWSSALS